MDEICGHHRENFNELLANDVERNFPAFAKAHEGSLRSYITGMGVRCLDVDEITHDSLVEMCLWLKGCHFQKIRTANLKSYLYRIAENRVRVKQREYRRYDRPQFQDALITEADIFDELIDEDKRPKGPEDVYLYKEWRQELLLHLPEDYREVFTAYLDGWSFQEIATYLNITLNSVKYIWRQCRRVLQALPELRY